MATTVFDRVWETTTTTGTGTVTLLGAKTGFVTFSIVGDGNLCFYCITNGTDWEVGQGTYTVSGTTLSRTTIYASTNANAAVNFGAGTKDVFLTAPAILLNKIENITSGQILSGQIGGNHIASGGILSGHIASGQIGINHIGSSAIQSGHVASGSIGTNHLQSGGITATLGSGSVVSGNIASGQIGINHIGSGAVRSGHISSGSIGTNHIAIGGVLSGNIASGQIGTNHLASGATITRSQFTGPFVSGTSWTMLTEEIISGTRAVSVSQSGRLRVAMASVSGRMPAIGIVVDGILSGIQANVFTQGVFQVTSGMANYSGYLGQPLYAGRSGQIVTTSGDFNSGGFASGDIYQRIGVPFNSGGVVINMSEAFKLASG